MQLGAELIQSTYGPPLCSPSCTILLSSHLKSYPEQSGLSYRVKPLAMPLLSLELMLHILPVSHLFLIISVISVLGLAITHARVKKGTSDGPREEPPVESLGTDVGERSWQPLKDPAQKLHSLIIGIDRYPRLDVLRGAVADAEDMKKFLEVDLGVPTEHIVTLHNKQATRSRILQEFQEFRNNPSIKRNDPILIYFAGHGGLAKADEKWKDRYGAQQIQVIFPFDYLEEHPNPNGTKSAPVNAIPDRTISRLLNELAAMKGDNITVIFDSCHSASGTRAGPIGSGDRRYRGAEVGLDIPHDIDDAFFASNGITLPFLEKQPRDAQLLLHTDQNSHIHFAACGIHQQAMEEDGRGIFTTELLKKIRGSQVNNITYHNLVKCLKITANDQSPQCYGVHKERILFNAQVYSYSVVPVSFQDSIWRLEAGEASGVTENSIWRLYETSNVDSKTVGIFKVTKTYAAVAVLEPLDSNWESLKSNANRQLFARCESIGEGNDLVLKVWASHEDQKLLFGDREFPGNTQGGGISYRITPERDSAEVTLEVCSLHPTHPKEALDATKAEVIFHLCHSIAEQFGTKRLQQRKPARREAVEIVLFAAARWRWHLHRKNSNGRLLPGVSMSMLKLANYSHTSIPVDYLPEPELMHVTHLAQSGSNQASPSLMVDDVVELSVDSSLYGFHLQSTINSPVYVRMFYFDASDFSISDMFGHNTANSENISDISSGGQLLIGDGADGGSAIRFKISSGQRIELGYMKVFWSTQPLELDYIKQKSAFDLKVGEMRAAEKFKSVKDERWGTACLALILRDPA
ncbi:unnamed protein product [Rhizoctonia solani]|uniref:Peptidase C14 caspase domain-containing protein n=1 Tax=Rhizoctonia solani TaxID=456999 RepID=A0A8H3B400_9AGAM|nr:unnamed protein product [Rhizoctonia solani]